MIKNLTNIEKKALKKKSYSLKPIISIGKKGLTNAVLTEIDVALNAHELIKIRIRTSDKNERMKQCFKIKQQLNAELVHQIGFIKIFYRLKENNL